MMPSRARGRPGEAVDKAQTNAASQDALGTEVGRGAAVLRRASLDGHS